jgi:hypothetical protein
MKPAITPARDLQVDDPPLTRTIYRVATLFAVAVSCCLGPLTAMAQDQTTVSSCPGQGKLPVSFQIDCTHLKDAATKQLCRPFIENQACKVFPAYRKITGIKLEESCASIKFNIYEDDTWPHPKGEAGGLAGHCSVDYLARYSVKFRADSKMGPYDVHELLHEYQLALGPLPSMHPLFASSMAEAMREIGDSEQYQLRLKQMKSESQRLHDELASGKYKSDPKECSLAQTQVEESLYLENSKLASIFYLKLAPAKGASQAERDARFNRMFYVVSGPKPEVKQFLMDHGCGRF